MGHSQRQRARHSSHTFGSSLRNCAALIAVAFLIFGLASPASAQYFGRNKVRYRAFDFQVMKTEHFDIYFYPSEREGVDIAARLAERWYARLERVFSHKLSGRQTLVLYGSHADFEQTNIVSEELTEGTGGFTEPLRRRIVLPLAGAVGDTDHVIGHELVHAFQFDIAGQPGNQLGQTPFARLPLWFVEGMAEYLSLGRIDANAAMKVRDAVRRNQLPSILDLDKPKYFPYQWGHAVFAYIGGRYGDPSVARLFRSATAYGDVEEAIKSALGISAQELSRDWQTAVRELYEPVLSASMPLPAAARLDIKGQRFGAGLNVAPALSPDGRWIAFLSARSLFSTDLYVADTKTGRVVRRLTSTATDPHYSSIQFINSAGTWDGASEHIAIGTIIGGRPALAIFNARTGKRDRDIFVKDVDEVLNPSWAPDGHAIAFTGMRQGLTDLYAYDLRTSSVVQITNDAYAELHPAWSPDSRRIAFATDRFTSDLETAHMGALRLATIDVETREVHLVPAFDSGKHINPQWSADGGGLYFVADPDGVPNVYRLSFQSREIEQMTALGVGVSGITPFSPALSVSPGTERLAVSAYEDEGYGIFVWNGAEPARPLKLLAVNAAALPPPDPTGGARPVLFARPDPGLPLSQAYPTSPYKSKLKLTGVGQPTAGVGISSFGPVLGGGAGFTFSDALGDRLLSTAVQVGTGMAGAFSFNDVAFEVGYLDRGHRWNWGLIAGQIPYMTGTFEVASGTAPTGEELETDTQTLYRETQRNTSAIVMFPVDRSRRVELQGGVLQAVSEKVVSSTTFDVNSGDILSNNVETFRLSEPLNLATTAAAFVSDTTSLGPTSPIQGQRYRVEVSPTFGSVDFTNVLVDYRRYVMPVPFYTIAARVIHDGRYGSGAEDLRLHPLFINDPRLVRGYDIFDSSSVTCLVTYSGLCPSNDPFLGSRILVGNLELRFPLLRPFGASRGMYGPVPIEMALFGDAGVAWNRGERPALFGGSQPGISSAGAAFRFGLGFAVAEFDVVRPFQNATRGWTFGFNLIPGW